MNKSQKILCGDKKGGKKLVAKVFNKSDCLKACVEIIVINETTFSTVEHMGFNRFIVL